MEEARGKYEFHVSWQPFLLRPNMPPEGIAKPDRSVTNRVSERLQEAGVSVGINFTGNADRYPNTVKAHALLEMTKCHPELQNKLAEALFKAYFTDGSVLTDADLLAVAESVGVSQAEAQAVIHNEARLQEAHKLALSWSSKGVSGVPMFFMNDQRTFSGAQDKEAFLNMFDIIAKKFSLDTNMGSTLAANKT